MAKTVCPNGHSLWNGDGKPVVFAFRVGFFREFMKSHPDCILSLDNEFYQLYDCIDSCIEEYPLEDLDCWYCDICKGLAIFVSALNLRYDFNRIEDISTVLPEESENWEEYVALRNKEFVDQFMDHCEGKSPLQAIETYNFTYRFKVSPDKKLIYAFNRDGAIAFGYERTRIWNFD